MKRKFNLPDLPEYQGGIYPNPYFLLDRQPVSIDTKKSYKLGLDNLRKIFNAKNIDLFFKDPQEKIDKIIEIFGNTEYAKKILNVLTKYMSLIQAIKTRDIYLKSSKEIGKLLDSNREKNERVGKVEENWVDFIEIVKLKNKLIEKKENQKALLLSLYTDIPPVRNDYWNLKTKNYDIDKDNYIKGKKIVLNQYKTFKTYGKIVIKLPDSILDLVKKNKNKTDYLFITVKGKPFTASNFSKYFQGIFKESFGKNTNFQIMRNIYLTYLAETRNDMTYKEMSEIARVMAHSVVQGLLYRKFKK